MRRLVPLAALVLSVLAVTGCATMSVSSHMQRGLDFALYRTYDWGPADALPIGDPRLDKDPFFRDHLEGAVERQLAAKGFERDASGSPDLLIHYHASIKERIDVNRADRNNGYCSDPACVSVVEITAGTLVLDVVDRRTNRVIWRGWAQQAIGDMLENRDRMAGRIEEAASRMLVRLPRSLGEK